jgi:hypothetical protein
MEQLQVESQDEKAQEISLVAAPHPSFVEHDNVYDIFVAAIIVAKSITTAPAE